LSVVVAVVVAVVSVDSAGGIARAPRERAMCIAAAA
jgi:hypothetical protein